MSEEKANKPLFVDGKINSELLTAIRDHKVMEDQKYQYESFIRFVTSAGKLFGHTLMYSQESRSFDSDRRIYLDIYQGGISEDSQYYNDQKGRLFSIVGGRLYYEDPRVEFNVTLYLSSLIAREVMSQGAKYNNHNSSSRFTLSNARGILDDYQKRLGRIAKQHSFKRSQLQEFVNALELYSGYARMKNLEQQTVQLNVVNYIARSVKAGMPSEKAVWMVYNRFSTKLADDFSEIPINWLENISK